MSSKSILAIIFGLLVFSCTDPVNDPIIEEKKELKINVLPGAFQGGLSTWIILNDSEGEVISYQQVSNGQTYSIEIPNLDRASLSLLNVASTSQGQNFIIQSYQMIKLENEITLGLRPSGYSTPQKGVPIQIQVLFPDFGGWAAVSHSSGEMSNKLVTQQYLDENKVNLRFSPVIDDPDYLLMAENAQGEKRSTMIFLDGSSDGLTINFEDLTPINEEMISQSEVLDPAFQLLDYSIYEAIPVNETWYRNGYLWDSKNLNPFIQGDDQKLYLPNGSGLKKVEFTYLNSSVPAVNFFYSGVGESIDLPLPVKGEFTVQNKTFSSFAFSKLPGASDWKISFSRPSTSSQPPYQAISAEIYGGGSGFAFSLPDELLTLYPFLDQLNSLEANAIDQNFRSDMYDNLIYDRLVELPKLKTGFVLQVKKAL